MTDTVEMPFAESFRSGQDYYSVLFHELTHSSGHESRLNRKGVAGMGATFLCGQAGIVERTIENSAAYVQGWLERLRNDKRLVVQAAAQAQKSADWILDRQFKQESELPV
jgi:antirestriction protein ArdC